jgi:hypothetical protein
MKKAMETDVIDLGDILESFVKKLDKLSEPELIDLAARLKPAAKACKTIDEAVKEMVKEKLDHQDGTRLGAMFKAILKLVPTKRLNQKRLLEEKPAIHAAYNEDVEDERVTFELR